MRDLCFEFSAHSHLGLHFRFFFLYDALFESQIDGGYTFFEQESPDTMQARDLYLQAKEKILNASILANGDPEKSRRDALNLLEKATQLDPTFAQAYCAMTSVHDYLFLLSDPTAERRALANDAIKTALRLQPDLPEFHLEYAHHLYRGYRDYERARTELAIAKRGLPKRAEVLHLEALIGRRLGQFEKAVQLFEEAIKLDPRNPQPIFDLAETLSYTRQFSAAEVVWERLINLLPSHPIARAQKEACTTVQRTANDTTYRSLLDLLSRSIPDDKFVVFGRLNVAIDHCNWPQAKQLLERTGGGDDTAQFAYGGRPVPSGCYSILLARLARGRRSKRRRC